MDNYLKILSKLKFIKEITELLNKVKAQENLSEQLQNVLQGIFSLRMGREVNAVNIPGAGGGKIQARVQIIGGVGGGGVGGGNVQIEKQENPEVIKQLEGQYALLTKIKTEKSKNKEDLLKDIAGVRGTLKKEYEQAESIEYKQLSGKEQEALLDFIVRLCGIDKEFLDNYQPEKKDTPNKEEIR